MKRFTRYPGGKAGGFIHAGTPQKKNYLGRSVICGDVRACASRLKVVTNLERDTAVSSEKRGRKKENERKAKGRNEACSGAAKTEEEAGDLRVAASSWGLMNDGRSDTTTLKLSG